MRRTKEEALETRNSILQAALECFSTYGYALTTFTEIASRIKMTKGAIFWHFTSKEHLLAEVIVWMHSQYEPLAGIDQAQSLDEVKAYFMDWSKTVLTNERHRSFLHFIMSRVEWSAALKEKLRTYLEDLMVNDPMILLEKCLTRLKEEGQIDAPIAPREIAMLFAVTFFGVHREVQLRFNELDVQKTLSYGLDCIIQSIRSK